MKDKRPLEMSVVIFFLGASLKNQLSLAHHFLLTPKYQRNTWRTHRQKYEIWNVDLAKIGVYQKVYINRFSNLSFIIGSIESSWIEVEKIYSM